MEPELPASRVWVGIVPLASGARLVARTVTSARCLASRPPGSRAVTVTTAVPEAIPEIVTVLPDVEAFATPESEVSAV